MPMKYRKIFAHEDIIVPYRLRKDGVYEARVRRKDLHIEVSARDFAALKEKFIRALHKEEEPAPAAIKDPKATNFGEFTLQWLEVKQALVKPSTFKEYDRLCRKNLIPAFGQYSLSQIDRDKLQSYLLGFVKEGKHRTAEKLADLLRCIFDVAADDYKIPSPMAKVVLPRYQTKKGSALTYEEEAKLVRYCRENADNAATDAILALLYSECGRANLQPCALQTASGWRSKRAKSGWGRTSFCGGRLLRRWRGKFCRSSTLKRRAPPTRGRSPRPSNGCCPITTFTNCAIHMSAAAKSAA